MAEFAVVAQARNGYEVNDLAAALEDGWNWGPLDLADFAAGRTWLIKVPSVSMSIARQALRDLWEPAMPGDSELGSPDIGASQVSTDQVPGGIIIQNA